MAAVGVAHRMSHHRSLLVALAAIVMPTLAAASPVLLDVAPPTWTIGNITDGSSNTISFGENPIDLRNRAFDVCFSNARYGSGISDGTSNAIVFGETVARRCYRDVEIAEALEVTVPAPAALPLLALAVAGYVRRRRAGH